SGLMANRPPVDLDGEIMNGCYAHAQKYGLTVVLDIGRPRNPCWQVNALSNAIKKYPEVTFVICHLLAPQRDDVELLKKSLDSLVMPNVYFDIASLASNQKPESYPYPTAVEHLRNAKSVVGADKLMFGTDMPCALARDSYKHLCDYIINSGVFTADELEDVFYNTANKVFFNI
ncbi:MAG: amidohydrolase, partial [Clostridia bacterium]|nr:amidohydrolase [Clostridia bacterium]